MMNLSDALGNEGAGGSAQPGWPNAGGGSAQPGWPGQGGPAQPAWPGQGGPAQPAWPGQGGPAQPAWPGQAGGSAQPGWPNPGGGSAQPGWPNPGGGSAQPGFQPSAPQALKVPYQHKLPSGVFDKLLITVKGRVKPNAQQFKLDFNKNRDIAFHFNVRFNDQGNKVVVRNSMIGSKWGKEERSGPFPFAAGQQFEMKVLCTSHGYKVAVNGSHLLEFTHRLTDLPGISHASFYGDIDLDTVLTERLP